MANWRWIVGALAAALWLAPAAAAAEEQGTMGQAGMEAKGQALTNADINTLAKLHSMSETEVEAGTWIKDNATNERVKDLANRMIDDHKALDGELTSFAQERGTDLASVSKPAGAEKRTRDLEKLKTMSGAQADRRYVRMAIEGHEQALKEARAAERSAKKSGKSELAGLYGKAAKDLGEQIKEARSIQKDLAQRQARTPRR